MIFQLATAVSWPMMATVTVWSMLLFCGYGLISTVNRTSIAALCLGAMSVASAMFLILELSHPYSGFFQISPKGIELLVDVIGARSGS